MKKVMVIGFLVSCLAILGLSPELGQWPLNMN